MATELMERSALLRDLDDALADAQTGGQIVVVCGEAGIGKSALVQAFVDRQDSQVRCLVGLCDPLLTPRALGPLHDIAAQSAGALAARLSGGASRDDVFTGLLEELSRHRRAQVLVFEDIHWADEATLDLLLFLSRRLANLRLLLVLTYRDDEVGSDHPLRRILGEMRPGRLRDVAPRPLSPDAVMELARRAGRRAAGLHAVTGGNPLLVTETLAVPDEGVPAIVRDLVLTRLAGLTPPAQQVVRLVSVVPSRTELWLLDAALSADADTVEACAASGLLTMDTTCIRFRHELTRQAVETSLSPPRRLELNRRVLRVLSTGTAYGHIDPARLAHHARQTEDDALTRRFSTAAGHTAAALGANRQAAEHFAAALVVTQTMPAHGGSVDEPTRVDLLELFAFSAYLAGREPEALEARREAVRIWRGSTSVAAQLRLGDNLRWISRLEWWSNRRRAADAAAAEAVTILEAQPASRELAMAYSNQSQLAMLADNQIESIELGTKALSVAAEVGDDETRAHGLVNIGSARIQIGDERGYDDLEAGFNLACEQKLYDHAVRALVNRCYTPLETRDYRRAVPYLQRALDFAIAHDLGGYVEYLMGVQAWCRLERGDWAGAEESALEALRRPGRPGIIVVPALVTLGRLQSRRGDDAAQATLDEAAERAFASDELQRIGPVADARAEHAWALGNRDGCAREAARGYDLALLRRHPWFGGALSWWLCRAGHRVDAPDWIAEPYALLLAGKWNAAADAWAGMGCPYEEADALSESSDDADLVRALEIFQGLGAVCAAQRVRRVLRGRGHLGLPRGPRSTTATNPAGLTARQLEILTLVAAGLTNAGIAERLTLSARTVEHHVSATLDKLGVASREEAAAAARDLGIVAT